MAEKRPRLKRPLPLSDLLEAVFAGKPIQKRLRELKVWQVWEEAVGHQIASRAEPSAFREGVLTVRVAGSAWMQQLSLMKQEIISNLNESAGETIVTDIFFKQGAITPLPSKPEPYTPPSRDLTTAEKALITGQCDSIADPELRNALETLMACHLKEQAGPESR